MKILVTICARGGSKGIPGKNIKLLNGVPLIAYTIKLAKDLEKAYNAVISVSTDDDEILNVCRKFGLDTEYKRPEYLAGDNVGKIDTIRDILIYEELNNGCHFDYVIDLDVTSPLRTFDDITTAFSKLNNDNNAINIFSVNKASRNPYFNMVEIKEDGYCKIVKSDCAFLTRQSAPQVFELNASFYIYRKAFFDQKFSTVFTDKSLIYEVPHICFDLDHFFDFEFLEYLLMNNKLNFKIW